MYKSRTVWANSCLTLIKIAVNSKLCSTGTVRCFLTIGAGINGLTLVLFTQNSIRFLTRLKEELDPINCLDWKELCPAVNRKEWEPSCLKNTFCRDAAKILCDEGQCKSIDCNQDSDCGSSSEYGCYIECNPLTDGDCSAYPLCPAMPKGLAFSCEESWGFCRLPQKIACQNHQCESFSKNPEFTSVDQARGCEQDSDCVSATAVGCYMACEGRGCAASQGICPAVNKNTFKPTCFESILCMEPAWVSCDKGLCTIHVYK